MVLSWHSLLITRACSDVNVFSFIIHGGSDFSLVIEHFHISIHNLIENSNLISRSAPQEKK